MGTLGGVFVKRSGSIQRKTPLKRTAMRRAIPSERTPNGTTTRTNEAPIADSRRSEAAKSGTLTRTPFKRKPKKGIPADVRRAVMKRAGNACERCKRSLVPLNLHHIRLRSQGGKDVASNLAALCTWFGDVQGCHDWCHANPAEAVREGWIKQASAEP